METFKRTDNGYFYTFYKSDILGKLEAIDLLQELLKKIDNIKKEITSSTPNDYLIELDKKLQLSNVMIEHLERLITSRYNTFGTTVYKGYTI